MIGPKKKLRKHWIILKEFDATKKDLVVVVKDPVFFQPIFETIFLELLEVGDDAVLAADVGDLPCGVVVGVAGDLPYGVFVGVGVAGDLTDGVFGGVGAADDLADDIVASSIKSANGLFDF